MSADPEALRIGLGWDRHRLVAGRRFVLGGLEIAHDRGPQGHSDGDVLLHAACDAVLGAAGEDDLGTLFPDDDAAHRGADSTLFVAAARRRLEAGGCRLLSLDAVVVTDAPKLKPHRAALRASLARLFGVAPDRVNLKAKTREGVGPDDVIEATVVALLLRS